MLAKNLDRFKVSTTKSNVTSFAGLPLLMSTARNLGLERQLNELKLKKRERGYRPGEAGLMLMVTMPAANTIG